MQRYALAPNISKQVTDSKPRQEQEIAELKRRLEKLQQTLRERGYLDNREDSTQASQARAQAMRACTIYELTEMEESLEKRVAAITSRPAPTNTQESRFNKMMVERGRRFLY